MIGHRGAQAGLHIAAVDGVLLLGDMRDDLVAEFGVFVGTLFEIQQVAYGKCHTDGLHSVGGGYTYDVDACLGERRFVLEVGFAGHRYDRIHVAYLGDGIVVRHEDAGTYLGKVLEIGEQAIILGGLSGGPYDFPGLHRTYRLHGQRGVGPDHDRAVQGVADAFDLIVPVHIIDGHGLAVYHPLDHLPVFRVDLSVVVGIRQGIVVGIHGPVEYRIDGCKILFIQIVVVVGISHDGQTAGVVCGSVSSFLIIHNEECPTSCRDDNGYRGYGDYFRVHFVPSLYWIYIPTIG